MEYKKTPVMTILIGTLLFIAVAYGCGKAPVADDTKFVIVEPDSEPVIEPVVIVEPDPVTKRGEYRSEPRIGTRCVVIHTLPNGACPPCEIWKRIEAPKLLDNEVDVVVLEDAKRAPAFHLFDGKKYLTFKKPLIGYMPAGQLLKLLGELTPAENKPVNM